jgi:hypothetical protein
VTDPVTLATFVLALLTVWLGVEATLAAREAYRARMDDLAPRVFVVELDIREKAVTRPGTVDADPPEVPPATPWPLGQYGAQQLGLQVRARLRNEGAHSGLLKVTCPAGVEIRPGRMGYSRAVESRGFDGEPTWGWIPLSKREGWRLVPPATDAGVELIWWRSSQDWADAWAPETKPPAATVELEVCDVTGRVRDKCKFDFGAFPLVEHPIHGWVTAARGLPPLQPEPVASVGLLDRSYRGAWRLWRARNRSRE